jgi:hypothetical protein
VQVEAPDCHDLIIALSWNLTIGTTYGMIIGCTEAEVTKMSHMLKFSRRSANHPFLALAPFAEVQLERLTTAYFQYRADFEQHSLDAGLRIGTPDLTGSMVNYTKLIKSVMVNYETSGYLVVTVQRFRTQLNKIAMDLEIKKLSFDSRSKSLPKIQKRRLAEQLVSTLDDVNDLVEKGRVQNSQASLLMSALWNLVAQRDNLMSQEIARKSKEISEQARLLALRSLELSRETRNITTEAKTIADDTKRDSTSMVAIATLTMVFLPLSFVATFLAMPIFNWQAKKPEKIVRGSQIAIYAYSAIPLTILVVTIWGFWLYYSESHRKRKGNGNAAEKLPVHLARSALLVAKAPLDAPTLVATPNPASVSGAPAVPGSVAPVATPAPPATSLHSVPKTTGTASSNST